MQLAEFDGVKKSLMRDLQNRCEKVKFTYPSLQRGRSPRQMQVVELEIQLDEIKEQYNNVIRNSNSKAQQKKMAFLERNLEQLTLVQKQVSVAKFRMPSLVLTCVVPQLVDQNSALKKEAGIAERKLLARNERIQNLEALLQDADRRLAAQNLKFEAQLQQVKERLDQARGTAWPGSHVAHQLTVSVAQKAAASSPLSFGRIAKPLRGGGGAASSNASSTSPSLGSTANPLTRVQNDER